jgi:hypothetical protein
MNIDELLALACSTAGRNCTQTEWADYFPGEPYGKTCPQWPDTSPKPPTPTPTPARTPAPTPTPRFFTPTPRPKLKSPVRDVVITKVEIADQDPLGNRPERGYQIVFVWFESASGNDVDRSSLWEIREETLEENAYVLGDDGSRSECRAIGATDSQFFLGFHVPTTASEFTLYFYDNPPIELALSP